MIEVCSKGKVKRDGNFKVSGSFDTSNYDQFVVIHIIAIDSSCKTYSKPPQENWSNVADSWYWKLRLTVPLFFKFVIKLLGTRIKNCECREIRGLRKFPHGFAASCVDYVCGSTMLAKHSRAKSSQQRKLRCWIKLFSKTLIWLNNAISEKTHVTSVFFPRVVIASVPLFPPHTRNTITPYLNTFP